MPPLAAALVRTGLSLKLQQAKRAAAAYMRDRTEQGESIAVSYATAAGLYAAAGIFLIAALLVGANALFRWIELNYGLFPAFGATGGLLVILTVLCVVLASSRLKRPAKIVPSLGSRLRVAMSASPARQQPRPAPADARGRPAPYEYKPSTRPPATTGGNGPVKAGLVLATALAGWAFARRWSLSRSQQPAGADKVVG